MLFNENATKMNYKQKNIHKTHEINDIVIKNENLLSYNDIMGGKKIWN